MTWATRPKRQATPKPITSHANKPANKAVRVMMVAKENETTRKTHLMMPKALKNQQPGQNSAFQR
ncbi:MAG: hypothetical protein ABI831_06765 [Betaproteobacteria bacterium]